MSQFTKGEPVAIEGKYVTEKVIKEIQDLITDEVKDDGFIIGTVSRNNSKITDDSIVLVNLSIMLSIPVEKLHKLKPVLEGKIESED